MRPNAEIPISTELLRMILDLPPEYKIVGALTRPGEYGDVVRLLVETPTLPEVARDEARHEIQPIMRRVETTQAVLDRIAVRLNAAPQRPTFRAITR